MSRLSVSEYDQLRKTLAEALRTKPRGEVWKMCRKQGYYNGHMRPH